MAGPCAALKSAAKICAVLLENVQFQGFAIISRYKVTYWGPKMTRKTIESSSCSREGCLQSIERLKAQPASRQWDLTSGGHLEAAGSLAQRRRFAQCFYEHYGDVL